MPHMMIMTNTDNDLSSYLDHVVAHGPREDHVCQQPGVVARAQTHLKDAYFL